MEIIKTYFVKLSDFLKSFSVAPTYTQAGVVIVLIFILVLSLAQFRHHFVKWSFKGGLIGLFFGIVLTLIVEGFLLVNGHTALTSLLGWKNAPKPISTALDIGKEKLTNVLGMGTGEIISKETIEETSKSVINTLQSLNPDEIKKVKAIICTP